MESLQPSLAKDKKAKALPKIIKLVSQDEFFDIKGIPMQIFVKQTVIIHSNEIRSFF